MEVSGLLLLHSQDIANVNKKQQFRNLLKQSLQSIMIFLTMMSSTTLCFVI